MTSPLVLAFYLSAGLFAFKALFMALIVRPGMFSDNLGFRATIWQQVLVFALFAGLQLACGLQYDAQNMDDAIAAHKWINTFYLCIPLLGVHMIDRFAGAGGWSPSRYSAALSVVFLGLLIANWVMPYGYRFDDVMTTELVALPWGEEVLIVRGNPSPLIDLGWVSCVLAVLYTSRAALLSRGQGDPSGAWYLWALVLSFVATTTWDRVADAGWLNWPYLDGFVSLVLMIGLLAIWGRDLRRCMVEQVQERESLNGELARAQSSDEVTLLPNRHGALQLLSAELESHARDQQALGVYWVHVDRLDVVRATHGEATADVLMAEMAQRLKSRLRPGDWVTRGTGSSFVVVVAGLRKDPQFPNLHRETVLKVRQQIAAAFDKPFEMGGKALHLRPTLGLAVFPDDGNSAESLMVSAEIAVQSVAADQGDGLHAFFPALREQLRERLELENELRQALQRQQFEVFYQPQVRSVDGRMTSMEALLRWHHPALGQVAPQRFVPLAEELGLMRDIGKWVLHSACEQMTKWRALGAHDLRLSVNMSSAQLEHSEVVADVQQVLKHFHLPAEALVLEVAEAALMKSPSRALRQLEALRQLGVDLMLDDFGTGYSSLSYLRILPLQGFKLAPMFIQQISNNPRDRALCAAAIDLAKVLNLEVVAEGVEVAAQAEALAEMGCDGFQGYWFAPVMPESMATRMVQDHVRQTVQRDEPVRRRRSKGTGAFSNSTWPPLSPKGA